MTFNGTFDPLSRKGMETSASPLQQISFESSLVFLKNATIRGNVKTLYQILPPLQLFYVNKCRNNNYFNRFKKMTIFFNGL